MYSIIIPGDLSLNTYSIYERRWRLVASTSRGPQRDLPPVPGLGLGRATEAKVRGVRLVFQTFAGLETKRKGSASPDDGTEEVDDDEQQPHRRPCEQGPAPRPIILSYLP